MSDIEESGGGSVVNKSREMNQPPVANVSEGLPELPRSETSAMEEGNRTQAIPKNTLTQPKRTAKVLAEYNYENGPTTSQLNSFEADASLNKEFLKLDECTNHKKDGTKPKNIKHKIASKGSVSVEKKKDLQDETNLNDFDYENAAAAPRPNSEIPDISPSVQSMSLEELKAHVEECIRLNREKKITTENAFALQLIDCMAVIIESHQEELNLNDLVQQLEAAVDIYSNRVDSICDDVRNIAEGLSTFIAGTSTNGRSYTDDDNNLHEATNNQDEDDDVERRRLRKAKSPQRYLDELD